MASGNGCKETAGFFGLAGQFVCQNDRLIAKLPGGIGRGSAEFPDRAGDQCGDIIKLLGRFDIQTPDSLLRQA